MANQFATKRAPIVDVTMKTHPPSKKQRMNSPSSLEVVQAILALRKRSDVYLPIRHSSSTAWNDRQALKRSDGKIDGIATISDDESDFPKEGSGQAFREKRERMNNSSPTTTAEPMFTFSFAPLPPGRPLAPAPRLPSLSPGQTTLAPQ